MNRITIDRNDFLIWRDGGGGTVEIFDIQVNSDRRKGIGRRLLRKLFEQLPPEARVFAITRTSNEIAQHFYEACHFHVAGVLRRFYDADHGADAIVYVRSAGGPL